LSAPFETTKLVARLALSRHQRRSTATKSAQFSRVVAGFACSASAAAATDGYAATLHDASIFFWELVNANAL